MKYNKPNTCIPPSTQYLLFINKMAYNNVTILITTTTLLLTLLINTIITNANKLHQGTKPNIVVMFVDDLGYGDVGFINPETKETPLIDAIAKKSLVLTDFHAGASVCTPSRAALLTGRLGLRTGINKNFGPTSLYGLSINETTIPEYLGKYGGYYTGGMGKWHLGMHAPYHPSYRFDYYLGIPYSLDMGCTDNPGANLPPVEKCPKGENTIIFNKKKTIENAINYYDAPPAPNSRVALPLFESYRNCSGRTCNEDIIQQPVDLTTVTDYYINNTKTIILNAQKEKKPFFIYLPFSHVHVPLATDPKFTNTSARGNVFGDVLMELDHAVHSVVETVEELAGKGNTLIIFTADNGPWNSKCDLAGSQAQFLGKWQETHGGGGGTGKFTLWEGGHREPFFAYWPGKIKPRIDHTTIGSTFDFLPTFLSLAGISLPTDRSFDGVSLEKVFFADDDVHSNNNESPPLLREFLFHSEIVVGTLNAMRYKDLKLFFRSYPAVDCHGRSKKGITHGFDTPLVFNLTADPAESNPITIHPDILLKCQNAYKEKLHDIQNTPYSIPSYATGGFYDGPCCDKDRPVCRCKWD